MQLIHLPFTRCTGLDKKYYQRQIVNIFKPVILKHMVWVLKSTVSIFKTFLPFYEFATR